MLQNHLKLATPVLSTVLVLLMKYLNFEIIPNSGHSLPTILEPGLRNCMCIVKLCYVLYEEVCCDCTWYVHFHADFFDMVVCKPIIECDSCVKSV